MKPEELLEAVGFLREKFEIVGVDISGEPRDALEMTRSEEINLELLKIILKDEFSRATLKSSSQHHHV
jgi:hypothetical protein